VNKTFYLHYAKLIISVKMKKTFFQIVILSLSLQVFGQRTCHTMENHDRLLQENPNLSINMQDIEQFTNQVISNGTVDMEKAVINIPVVVHVLYNTSAQNVSDAQIQSQLNTLNQDFRKLNSDWTNTPSTFTSTVADCEFNFCLATTSPTGSSTTGIIRRSTTVASFSSNDAMKYTAQGGSDAWPAGQYLNLWVCNLGGGLLGYAQFPGGAAATDGVVVNYTAFGSTGTAQAPFNKGRTATHEVGHWLNLRHIWGDATCGSDLVTDTPVHNTSNGGCPSHPKSNTCGTSAEMFMNYMDYTNDACMYMFSAGQKARMQALFVSGGFRASLKTSAGCSGGIATPQYCAAGATNTQFEWISNVKIGTINNTTASNGGYGNFTNLSSNVTKGTAYLVSLTPGFASSVYPEYFRVYIDYNADYDFVDAGELVYTSAAVTGLNTVSITIPTTAITGSTRMRVMMKDAALTGPCEAYTYGEVEDYTLNIQASATATCNQPASLAAASITATSASLSWGAVSGATSYTVQIKPSTSSTWTSYTTTGASYSASPLTAGISYNWQVRTNCSSGSSAYTAGANFTTTSTCSDVFEPNNSLSAAKVITVNTNVSALISTSTDIDWFKFTNTSAAKNIRISLTNLPLDYDLRMYNSAGTLLYSSENAGTTAETITYNNAPVATYYIRVISYNSVFSASSCYRVNASIGSTAFKYNMESTTEDAAMESLETAVSIFPNPSVDGKFACYVTNDIIGFVHLDIYDAAGRLINSKTFDKTEKFVKSDVDVSQKEKGVYYVKIYNQNFQQTVKLVFAD
jgi:hypothetical protein